MKEPPKNIDDAKVLEWAWSGEKPFGFLFYENGEVAAEIYGLAICQNVIRGQAWHITNRLIGRTTCAAQLGVNFLKEIWIHQPSNK